MQRKGIISRTLKLEIREGGYSEVNEQWKVNELKGPVGSRTVKSWDTRKV